MSKKTVPALHVISANRLTDGVVVYRCGECTWSEAFSDALVLSGESLEDELVLAKADEVSGVVGVYSHEVSDGAPAHIRDRIRAEGPTVLYKTSPSAKAH
ncbi:DUF2849 domain-containing protein [Rhodospirillum sp. A1_3_36]|uniref:DUF2849 domain-containing protein n=1 Tax=Rhodospirillum sp. A1_3_36 TaxID=3391666 RepID=UPI0039A6DCEB